MSEPSDPSPALATRLREAPRWALVALLAVAAVGLRAALQPALGDRMPFIVAYPAIVLAASMWGIGAGLVVAAASIVAVVVPFVPPDMGVAEQPVHVGSFTLVAILICIAGSLRSRRAARDADDPPLTGWLRAVLWGAVLIPLLAFLSAAWWGYERAHEDAEATAARAAVLVRDHAQHTFDIAGTIARRADTIASGSDGEVRAHEAEIHRRLADMVLGLPSVVNLNVWDENGVALARSDRYPGGRVVPVADRAYFMAERPPGARPMISEVIHGRQTGRELMNLALRRGGDDPRFSGVVTVSMAPGFFRDYYRSLARDNPNLARFALVRTDGTVLAAWPPRPPGDDRLRPDDAILSRVRAGERTGRQLVTAERGGERRYVSFQRVGDYPLYVMAGVSRRAMLAGWLHFVGLLSALLLPVTAGLTYVSLVAIRKTRREQAIGVELAEAVRRRAAAERAAMESQKLETLAQLTGGVAHDFNNLLAIISSSLQVHLHLHPALAGERHLQAIARAVRSGTRLTRQLLSFSRRQALRPETIALQAWLPGAGDLLRSTVGSRVELAIAVAPDTRPVRVDLAELELSLINLALNARHAMPAGGALRIGARNEFDGGATRVVIAVSDTGVGIPADVLPRVFEPFYTTRSHESGSGLGLSQVHGFCAQAGGRVRIASEPGQGTTVEMLLPAEEATAPRANVQDDGPWERLAGRVMLVEDNGDVAASTAAILQAAGLEVTHMWSADTALAALQGGAPLPSLVLSDIEMPGRLSGLDLALRLRDRWPRLPVILVTGYATQLDEAVAAGLRVLPKPTAAGELLRVLRQALDAAPRASPDPVAAPS